VCSAKQHRDTPSPLHVAALPVNAGKQQTASGQRAGKKFTGMSMMTDAETAAAADLSAEQHRTASMFLSGSQPAACIDQLYCR